MPAQQTPASMQRLLLAAAGTHARLSFYPPGLRQPAHRHEQAHVSIVVTGAIRERRAGRDEIGFASALTLRPHEIRHEVEFGPQGALILAVDVDEGLARAAAKGWIHRNLASAQRTLLQWVLTEGAVSSADVGDCLQDLLAGIETESLRGSPPRWLMRAREQLSSDPAGLRIDTLARAAGVHRAHFARAFQHWFGIPPSSFRRRAMLNLAIAAIASGQSIAGAAHSAGFADQSHEETWRFRPTSELRSDSGARAPVPVKKQRSCAPRFRRCLARMCRATLMAFVGCLEKVSTSGDISSIRSTKRAISLDERHTS